MNDMINIKFSIKILCCCIEKNAFQFLLEMGHLEDDLGVLIFPLLRINVKYMSARKTKAICSADIFGWALRRSLWLGFY